MTSRSKCMSVEAVSGRHKSAGTAILIGGGKTKNDWLEINTGNRDQE